MKYRGWTITELSPGKWKFEKKNEITCYGLGSKEAAKLWVDKKIKRIFDARLK